MTTRAFQPGRCRFIKNSVVSLAAAPFANALLSGTARGAEADSESDPMATALGYKMDATKASNRQDQTAVCGNCSLYSGGPRRRRSLQCLRQQAGQRQRLVYRLGQEILTKP